MCMDVSFDFQFQVPALPAGIAHVRTLHGGTNSATHKCVSAKLNRGRFPFCFLVWNVSAYTAYMLYSVYADTFQSVPLECDHGFTFNTVYCLIIIMHLLTSPDSS